MAGVYGNGYQDLIKQIYERCCELDNTSEVWLYGFSRGAYIARAVAGMLHFIGALKSAGRPEFGKEYKQALKMYGDSEKRLWR